METPLTSEVLALRWGFKFSCKEWKPLPCMQPSSPTVASNFPVRNGNLRTTITGSLSCNASNFPVRNGNDHRQNRQKTRLFRFKFSCKEWKLPFAQKSHRAQDCFKFSCKEWKLRVIAYISQYRFCFKFSCKEWKRRECDFLCCR